MRRRHVVGLVSGASVALAVASLHFTGRESSRTQRSVSAPPDSPARAKLPDAASAPGVPHTPSRAPERVAARALSTRDRLDEASIMTELRTLAQSDPVRSLELVRVGDTRFPGNEDAPERAWFKIRSLVNLGRFDEARAEAMVMVDTYRDTPWAGDVERHLLTQPLNDPSQRGNLLE